MARWSAPALRKFESVVVEAKSRALEINEDSFCGCDESATKNERVMLSPYLERLIWKTDQAVPPINGLLLVLPRRVAERQSLRP